MNLKQHLLRQMAFSHATYGPSERTVGVCKHICNERYDTFTVEKRNIDQ